jgi:hypothetical protein
LATPTIVPSSLTVIPDDKTLGGNGAQYLSDSPGIPIKTY